MTESDPEPNPAHKRRPRYRGTHPRTFGEKYKELAPEKYPDLVEHVKQRGMTPAGQHVSIMVDEVLAALDAQPGERGVDGTLGYGGHASRILERLVPGGRLLGLDVDPIELPKTEARLRKLISDDSALLVRRTNFAGLRAALFEVGFGDGVDFVFVDLGVSSMQIDDPTRGFTFKVDAPLDMRMNPARGVSAAQWLERVSIEELTRVLVDNSDEPFAERIAREIDRRRGSLLTTRALADAIREALPKQVDEDEGLRSTRRVFQAVRIEVNDELRVLDGLLRALPECLRPGGRAVVLTFHSGEDRRVKRAFEAGVKDGVYSTVNDDVIRASPEEQRANPRSSSAKLRWALRP
ncbi:MAG: 16S rRNA (cytosine(1402)-N(4))-methyltransferase RsmH [Planctomycetota bacterium]|nr:16S rRNA (cytosine(1402)-N(4))-methyltransferase RsmH [Planctomycetota bacterium]